MHVLDRLDPAAVRRLTADDEFFWLDLEDPSREDLAALGALLQLHPLALEDSLEFGQRPKLDEYGDKVLLVYHAISDDVPVEVHVQLSGAWIVTVHREPCAPLAAARRWLRGRLRAHRGRSRLPRAGRDDRLVLSAGRAAGR